MATKLKIDSNEDVEKVKKEKNIFNVFFVVLKFEIRIGKRSLKRARAQNERAGGEKVQTQLIKKEETLLEQNFFVFYVFFLNL